jgi:hypothetical protein
MATCRDKVVLKKQVQQLEAALEGQQQQHAAQLAKLQEQHQQELKAAQEAAAAAHHSAVSAGPCGKLQCAAGWFMCCILQWAWASMLPSSSLGLRGLGDWTCDSSKLCP